MALQAVATLCLPAMLGRHMFGFDAVAVVQVQLKLYRVFNHGLNVQSGFSFLCSRSVLRPDGSVSHVQYLAGEMQLVVVLFDSQADHAQAPSISLWIPVSVLVRHGYVMDDQQSQPFRHEPLHRRPQTPAPIVHVRMGLRSLLESNGLPAGHPLAPTMTTWKSRFLVKPSLYHSDIM